MLWSDEGSESKFGRALACLLLVVPALAPSPEFRDSFGFCMNRNPEKELETMSEGDS